MRVGTSLQLGTSQLKGKGRKTQMKVRFSGCGRPARLPVAAEAVIEGATAENVQWLGGRWLE
jgi:hypothetical protein